MTDITNLFKATVKTVRVKEKVHSSANLGPDKSILPTHKSKSEFSVRAKDVTTHITNLREFLLKHRKDYINANGHLGGDQSKMSDAERDQIDLEAELFIKTCAETIRQLKADAHSHKVLRQVKDHKDAVLELIDKYLVEVCRLYSEQRAVRVKRVVDRKRISRLEPDGTTAKHDSSLPLPNPTIRTDPATNSSPNDNTQKEMQNEGSIRLSAVPVAGLTPTSSVSDLEPLSAEEAQLLAMENDQLFEEMSSMVDEVRQIEGKIVEIARLQEIFADKVLEQAGDINKISDTVVGTTENLKEANEEIREAMKNNAGFRVWILFFLIVCSFSLLFLDWYNA